MARAEDAPRVFAELREGRHYQLAGCSMAILELLNQVVGWW